MRTWCHFIVTACLLVMLCQEVYAQRGGRSRGADNRGRGKNGPPPPESMQGNANSPMGNPSALGFSDQNGRQQNMPTVTELSQMLIANFDADASGELSQAELQSALIALREMMQQRMQGARPQLGQNRAGQAANTNRRNDNAGGLSDRQAGPAPGGRPPRPGGGDNGRRSR